MKSLHFLVGTGEDTQWSYQRRRWFFVTGWHRWATARLGWHCWSMSSWDNLWLPNEAAVPWTRHYAAVLVSLGV